MDYYGPNVLARVFLTPAANIAPFTGPSTKLQFRMGMALTSDLCSVLWAMQQPNCTIEVQPRYVTRVDEWRQQVPDRPGCRAKIILMPPNPQAEGVADVSVTPVGYEPPPPPTDPAVAEALAQSVDSASPFDRYVAAWSAA